MMGDTVPEQTNLVQRGVGLFPQKGRRDVHEESSQVRAPEIGFVLRAEKTHPEPKAELGYEAVRLERLAL